MKQRIAFAMIMGIITTGLISFILIAMNIGFAKNFLAVWGKSWLTSYVVVIPAILLIGPRIQLMVDKVFRESGDS